MKFARIGGSGHESPAVSDGSNWFDLSSLAADIDPALLTPEFRDSVARALAAGDLPPIAEGRFGPPLGRVGKIVCVGLNYRDHAAETGAAIPAEPILFMKAADTVVGPDDEVLVPRGSDRTDWEVELAVVIGTKAAYLEGPEAAAAVIAGYTISHDVSERTFQLDRGGQWDKGKNAATFNPMGPWLVTADEVADPQDLALQLSVNGELMQNGTTADMIFPVTELVAYISQFMTLYPGDVINTGTPAGVGLGRPEPRYLAPGDVVEVSISGLGQQRQKVGAA